jgi:hypothetical protein
MQTPTKPSTESPGPRPGQGRAGQNIKDQRHTAAVKIQSSHRKNLAKSKVQLRREEEARRQNEIKAENARLRAAKKNAVGKADKQLSRETLSVRKELSQEEAAAKIQSQARGTKARKETKGKILQRRQSAIMIQKQARKKAAASKVQLRREEEARRQNEIKAENARLRAAKKNAVGKADKELSSDVLAKRNQLKNESDAAYKARLKQESETKQQLENMKANAVGRADKELSSDVLAKRNQLKNESDAAFKARLKQESETKQKLENMKANAVGKNDTTLSSETQEMRALLAEPL